MRLIDSGELALDGARIASCSEQDIAALTGSDLSNAAGRTGFDSIDTNPWRVHPWP